MQTNVAVSFLSHACHLTIIDWKKAFHANHQSLGRFCFIYFPRHITASWQRCEAYTMGHLITGYVHISRRVKIRQSAECHPGGDAVFSVFFCKEDRTLEWWRYTLSMEKMENGKHEGGC